MEYMFINYEYLKAICCNFKSEIILVSKVLFAMIFLQDMPLICFCFIHQSNFKFEISTAFLSLPGVLSIYGCIFSFCAYNKMESGGLDIGDYEALPDNISASTHMIAGATAGITEHCIMYPVDCIKVSTSSMILSHFTTS